MPSFSGGRQLLGDVAGGAVEKVVGAASTADIDSGIRAAAEAGTTTDSA
jgi:hypothetical protein